MIAVNADANNRVCVACKPSHTNRRFSRVKRRVCTRTTAMAAVGMASKPPHAIRTAQYWVGDSAREQPGHLP